MSLTFEKAYNKHYHTQHINNGMDVDHLVVDEPGKVFYPENPGVGAIKRKIALALMDSHINVKGRGSAEKNYEQQMMDLFAQLETKSVVIITNHVTFGNFPVIIIELRKWARKLGIKFDFDINTILGPALTTSTQRNSIGTISNLIKTIPATGNSTIPGFKKECGEVREQFKNTFFGLAKEPGHIFLLAPTGTRDFTSFLEDGTPKGVYFEGDASIRHSMGMIKAIADEGIGLCIMGVNETAIKKGRDETGKTILTRDNNWGFGDVMIGIEGLTKKQAQDLLASRRFMDRLAYNILDEKGNQIGAICSSSELKDFKKGDILAPRVSISHERGNPFVEGKKLESNIRSGCRKLFEILK